MLQQLALAVAFLQASLVSRAVGHGNIFDPKPEGKGGAYQFYFGGPAGSINMPEMVTGVSYGEYYKGVDNWFTKNSISSVKEYVAKYTPDIPECGNTKKKGTPQSIPSDGYVQHDTLGNSHPGPCEIWCDNTRVFHDTNCAGTFAGQVPTKLPVDVNKCKASSELVFYWLALHVQPWQVYINCVNLGGSGGSNTNSTSKKTTKKTKNLAFDFVDEGSVAGEASDEETTETPVVTSAPKMTPAPVTEAPAAMTAPSTSSSKCLRRRS